MTCPKCQAPILEDARFRTEYGATISSTGDCPALLQSTEELHEFLNGILVVASYSAVNNRSDWRSLCGATAG